MNTKTIFKTLALAMLMPAMLLTTACSSDDDVVNNTANTENTINKGYALPVTVNVTRQADGATRATYNESTRKLEFGPGDQLFVEGSHIDADRFAGTLTWQSGGTFSGTIYTESPYEGTIDDLLNGNYATLLPAGYESTGYLEISDDGYQAHLEESPWKLFATSKAAGVEQLSFEHGEYTSGTGFVLEPRNAILNFTITGLTASTKVTAALSDDEDWTPDIEGEVTTDGSGNVTFAIGLEDGSDLNEFSLTVAGNPVTLVNSSTPLAAGKIYNINRAANAINGKFSVSATKQVYFSKGNLRCVSLDSGTSWSWSFFEHQYDRYSSFNAYSWDKFGWVGESGTLKSGIELWGASISNTPAGYGASTTEKLKSDWGNVPGIGSGWRTLSGGGSGEWYYLFNTRSASTVNGTADARFAKGKVNDRYGVILFPDTYSHPEGVTLPVGINDTGITGWNSNSYDVTAWAKMEAAGCVFLPTAGSRIRDGVSYVDRGYYWSSTAYYNNEEFAYDVYFGSDFLHGSENGRWWGESVRLVREVE